MAELNEAHFLVHSANKDKKYQGEKIVSWYIKIERADGRVEFLTSVPKEVSIPVDTWLSTIEHK
jgi:hypothetical protein